MVKWLLKQQGGYYPKGDVLDVYREGFPEEHPEEGAVEW